LSGGTPGSGCSISARTCQKAAETLEGLAKLVDSRVVRWKKVLASVSKDAAPAN
jgi:hypothetical protein